MAHGLLFELLERAGGGELAACSPLPVRTETYKDGWWEGSVEGTAVEGREA